MKVLTIVGARPQFIKAAPVSKALRQVGCAEFVVHTGQHYDREMSQLFFEELGIPEADVNLGVGSGPHGSQTARMLSGIEEVLLNQRPDRVLVYGDTNSTLAGALAAVKLGIPLAHVEAGLRSFNKQMPEEHNRVLADHCADLLFCPTQTAVDNLGREGITKGVHLVGDTMYDSVLQFSPLAKRNSKILETLGLTSGSYLLATVHRAYNTDDPDCLRAIFRGLMTAAHQLPVVVPLHPRTRAALRRERLYEKARELLLLIEPVGYLDMLMLEKNARLIATDSGGVQKEAYFYRVPCVTLRAETEWLELVESGWNRVAKPVNETVVAEAIHASLDRYGSECSLYGTGFAAQTIASELSAL